MNILLVLK